MPETLEGLEQRRQQLYQQLAALDDFRPGMISVNYRKCGKANCACARTGHSGHGPQYLWNTTQQGKSQAQNLRLGPELEKVERELETYQRFLALCRELVEVNSRICQLRPLGELPEEEELERLKKKLQKKYNKRRNRR
jgi:uncharacterized protein YbaP (TraB family)